MSGEDLKTNVLKLFFLSFYFYHSEEIYYVLGALHPCFSYFKPFMMLNYLSVVEINDCNWLLNGKIIL